MISIGVFLIGLIQLNEFFLWRNQTCGIVNHLFSLSIVVILWLQSVLMLSSFYLFYPVRILPSMITDGYLVLCTAFTAYLLSILHQTRLCSRPNGSCRLAWSAYTRATSSIMDSFSFLFYYFFNFCHDNISLPYRRCASL